MRQHALTDHPEAYWLAYILRYLGAARLFSEEMSQVGGSSSEVRHDLATRMVARKMERHFASIFPMTFAAFCKNGRVTP